MIRNPLLWYRSLGESGLVQEYTNNMMPTSSIDTKKYFAILLTIILLYFFPPKPPLQEKWGQKKSPIWGSIYSVNIVIF